jgi:hypothetical protein
MYVCPAAAPLGYGVHGMCEANIAWQMLREDGANTQITHILYVLTVSGRLQAFLSESYASVI